MIKRGTMVGLIGALLLFAGEAQAKEKEPSAIVEIGGSGDWGLKDGGPSFGPMVAVEFTPIEHWLEIEAGVSTLFGGGQTEWSTDFLFKKPFSLSNNIEFMTASDQNGPSRETGQKLPVRPRSTSCPGPSSGARVRLVSGTELQPLLSANGHEQSLGVSVGLLIAIP